MTSPYLLVDHVSKTFPPANGRGEGLHVFALGKTKVFDPDKPDEYLASFAIRKA